MRFVLRSIKQMSPPPRANAWFGNERGSAAVEFALVAVPFFMFILGIIGVGLFFFTTSSLEHGVEAAARKIRTGEAQNSQTTVGAFKQMVCNAAGSYINCNNVHILVQHAPNWTGITPQPCLDNKNNMAASTGSSGEVLSNYSGVASEVVLVTVCYQWDLAQTFSFLNLGKNADGSGPAIVQATTAFRIEPYS